MDAEVRMRTALAVAWLWLGCAPPPPQPAEPTVSAAPRAEDFSRERAGAHLEALVAVASRGAASDGARRAREYLAGALRELDLEVQEQRSRFEPAGGARRGQASGAQAPAEGSPEAVLETVNLFAAIPGDSPDAILLIAPYDSPAGALGAGDGASGAALVLELGRTLKERRLPYTVWLAFVEGDALARAGGPGAPASELVGTGALVTALDSEGRLERVRVAVYFDRVADPGLRVARDLLSNRTWREEFWAAARRRGHTSAFPPDAPFESADAGHRAFLDVGMRRAVAIVGARSQANPPPDGSSGTPAEELAHGSPASLAVVGAVSVDALDAIAERLAKIDRFVESPVSAGAPAGSRSDEPAVGTAP